jgi:glutaminyl-peptide cyclotransferase
MMPRALRHLLPATALALLTACGDAEPPVPAVRFDGARALSLVQTQLDFGPRVPGTPGHVAAGDWIVSTLRPLADTVIEQRFEHRTADGTVLPMRNIFAQFNRTATKRILYVTHWDTRPVSEKGADAAEQAQPVPGANDGASGTAMLLVLAEALAAVPPDVGVDLLFTDGEDYGSFETMTDVLIGASYYAEHVLPEPSYRPMFGVLWDMVGHRTLQLPMEAYSQEAAPEVNALVWDAAARLGHGDVFLPRVKYQIQDDHVPLIAKGFRIVDVIDLDFPWHHTPYDTIDKVSARSLEIVGRVAMLLIREAGEGAAAGR